MTADDIKITWVSLDEVPDQQARPGFAPTCQYGLGMDMAPNELGAICKPRRGSPVWRNGLFVTGVTVLERLFIVEPA